MLLAAIVIASSVDVKVLVNARRQPTTGAIVQVICLYQPIAVDPFSDDELSALNRAAAFIGAPGGQVFVDFVFTARGRHDVVVKVGLKDSMKVLAMQGLWRWLMQSRRSVVDAVAQRSRVTSTLVDDGLALAFFPCVAEPKQCQSWLPFQLQVARGGRQARGRPSGVELAEMLIEPFKQAFTSKQTLDEFLPALEETIASFTHSSHTMRD